MDTQSNFPYRFDDRACKACGGKCCRGQAGYVWVSMGELEEMAGTRGLDVSVFARQYVRQVHGRLSLQERVINGEHLCCLFDPVDCRCTLYQSRPEQCRTFPFWESFKKDPEKLMDECPGVSLRSIDESAEKRGIVRTTS